MFLKHKHIKVIFLLYGRKKFKKGEVAKVAKVWQISYREHQVRVEHRNFSDKLIVDGELQDEQLGFSDYRSRLFGRIKSGEGQGEIIKVSLGGAFTVKCRIFIDDKLVFPERKRY